MRAKEIEFVKNLIIKLDVAIDAEHEKATGLGLNLIFDFTPKKRKKDILKALDILNEEMNQYEHI